MKKTRGIFKAVVKAFQRYHLLLAVAGVLIIIVCFYGLHDRGLIIAYIATAFIIAEITYRWRRILYFFLLAAGAFLSSVYFSFLHEEVVKPLVTFFLGSGALDSIGFRIFHEAVTLYLMFFGFMGIVLGVLGMVALGIYKGVELITGRRSQNLT